MEDKSLKNKAVNIKGKEYVLVQDRVLYFNEHYPKGSIYTDATYSLELKAWVVKADVWPDGQGMGSRKFTGHSQAIVGEGTVNKTAALENAETSAVGRALAFMGIGVIESIASADEIHKATAPVAPTTKAPAPKATGTKPARPQSVLELQKKEIAALLEEGADAPLETASDYHNECMYRTGMKLEEENYTEIIEALKK